MKTFSITWNHGFQSRVLIAKKDNVIETMVIEVLRFGNENKLNSLESIVEELKKNGYEEVRVKEWTKKN